MKGLEVCQATYERWFGTSALDARVAGFGVVPTIFMINLKQMPAQASVSSQG